MVDFVIEELLHKFLPVKLSKDGEKDKYLLTQVQVRVLPMGVYELIFPKEFLDEVLSALDIGYTSPYYKMLNKKFMGVTPIKVMRKVLGLKPVPEFKKVTPLNFPLSEYKKFVPIIPIGIKEDGDILEKYGEFKDWTHERI